MPATTLGGRNWLRRLRRGSRRRSSGRRSLILRAAKSENRPENEPQKRESKSEANSFSKTLCQIDGKNNCDDEIYEGNQQQDHPPTRSTDNLAPDVDVIDRND